MDHARRRDRLAERLADTSDADAFLITFLPNVRYLTGFTGSNGQVLVARDGARFFNDGRYIEQSRQEVPDLERVIVKTAFAKDLAMGASWATTIDIGHRYSGTVAGFMNMIGNLGTVFAAPVGQWIARRASPDGVTENWTAAIAFYAAMFAIACGCWLFIDPRRVVVYSPRDYERLKVEGVL